MRRTITFRNASVGMLRSLAVPVLAYVSIPIFFHLCVSSQYNYEWGGTIVTILVLSLDEIPTFVLLGKFWKINRGCTFQLDELSNMLILHRADGTSLSKSVSDVERVILVTTYSWKRKFWYGDGTLLWDPMHFATIVFRSNERMTITTLLVTNLPDLFKELRIERIEHHVKFYPFPFSKWL